MPTWACYWLSSLSCTGAPSTTCALAFASRMVGPTFRRMTSLKKWTMATGLRWCVLKTHWMQVRKMMACPPSCFLCLCSNSINGSFVSCERERERVRVCVCLCVWEQDFSTDCAWVVFVTSFGWVLCTCISAWLHLHNFACRRLHDKCVIIIAYHIRQAHDWILPLALCTLCLPVDAFTFKWDCQCYLWAIYAGLANISSLRVG